MEDYAPWMAAGLFSPSKARQQHAQAKDWLYVDEWLRRNYAPSTVPTFERNEETLQALMEMVAANERADERCDLIEQVERAALVEMQAQLAACEVGHVYESMAAGLDAEAIEAVASLAQTSVALGCDSLQSVDIAKRLFLTTKEAYHLAQQYEQNENLRHVIERETAQLQSLLAEFTGPAFSPPTDIHEKTTEWTRGAKHLKAKLNEYNDRLSLLDFRTPKPGMEDLQSQQAEGKRLDARLAEVEDALAAFRGLPQDPQHAYGRVEETRMELRRLVSERDEAFERLAQG